MLVGTRGFFSMGFWLLFVAEDRDPLLLARSVCMFGVVVFLRFCGLQSWLTSLQKPGEPEPKQNDECYAGYTDQDDVSVAT